MTTAAPRPRRLLPPVVLPLLLALSAAPAAAQQRADPTGPVVQGVLLDADSGRPVVQAVVRLFEDDDAVASTLSDSLGAFRLVAPEPGRYRLEAQRIGYVAEARALVLGAADTLRVEVRLRSAAMLLDPLLVRGEQAPRPAHCVPQLLLGRVVDDATGRGIAGAAVELLRMDGAGLASARADADGRFALVTPAAGAYRLRGAGGGYVSAVSGEVAVLPGDTISVELRLSTERALGEPVAVTGSSRSWEDRSILGHSRAFLERMEGCQHEPPLGSRFGEFLDRGRIAEWEGAKLGVGFMILQEVRTTWDYDPVDARLTLYGGCAPAVFVDGVYRPGGVQPLARLTPKTLEAVEILEYPHVPREYWPDDAMTSPCGAVLLWTRWPEGPPTPAPAWKRALIGVGALLAVIVLFK